MVFLKVFLHILYQVIKNMQRILSKNRNYLLLVCSLMGLGIILGIIYYHFLNPDIQNSLINTITNFQNFQYNGILKYLTIMSLLLISSFFIIGLPLSLFYLFYESLSLGFILNIFYLTFKIKGLLYALIYLLINKLLVLLLLIIFVKKCLHISRLIIGHFIYRKDNVIKEKIIYNFKSSLYIILYVLIINIVLYIISPYIFKTLAFLLH